MRPGAASMALFAAIFVTETASAQTTTCGWVLGKWACETQQSGSVFGGLQPPATAGNTFMDAFNRGSQEREARERAQLERQRIEAERDYYRSQTPPLAPSPGQRVVVPQETFVASLSERQKIGEMLKANDCAAATNRALELGDIQLATNIKEFCSGPSR